MKAINRNLVALLLKIYIILLNRKNGLKGLENTDPFG